MVHCLGGSLKSEGPGDDPKLNSRLPRSQLLLMNRISSTETMQYLQTRFTIYGNGAVNSWFACVRDQAGNAAYEIYLLNAEFHT
jgi:hypothetical protein